MRVRVGMLWGTDGKMKRTCFMEGRSLIRGVEREGETDNGIQIPIPCLPFHRPTNFGFLKKG
jgi:hypothetical protein